MKTTPFAMQGRFSVRLEQDDNARSPQEDGDHGLFLVAKHRQFFVAPPESEKNFEIQEVLDAHKKTHHVFPLEAYIHSGVALALSGEGNFPDRQWDVSQLGLVFVSKAEWPAPAAARKAALGYVATWNQYLSGDVYGYVVAEHETAGDPQSAIIDDHVESCWGYYGEEHAKAEGKQALEGVATKADEIPTLKALELVKA